MDTSYIRRLRAGYTDKMSFGFVVAEDKRESVYDRENDLETITRTITKIEKLYDVSAVSIPANDMTSISARRCADGLIDNIKAERLARARKKAEITIGGIKMTRMEEIEARLAAIAEEAEKEGANIDELTEEVRKLKKEKKRNRGKQRKKKSKTTSRCGWAVWEPS